MPARDPSDADPYATFSTSRAAVDPARAGLLVAGLAVGLVVAVLAVPAPPAAERLQCAEGTRIWDAPDAATLATIGKLAERARGGR